jgi:hypothetical protein
LLFFRIKISANEYNDHLLALFFFKCQAEFIVSRLDRSLEGEISFEEFERFMHPSRNRSVLRAVLQRLVEVRSTTDLFRNGLVQPLFRETYARVRS